MAELRDQLRAQLPRQNTLARVGANLMRRGVVRPVVPTDDLPGRAIQRDEEESLGVVPDRLAMTAGGDTLERRPGRVYPEIARGQARRERRRPCDAIRNRPSNRSDLGDAGRNHQDHLPTKPLDPLDGEIAEDRKMPAGGDDASIGGDAVLQERSHPCGV